MQSAARNPMSGPLAMGVWTIYRALRRSSDSPYRLFIAEKGDCGFNLPT